jgi:hypothetical protein
MSGISMLAPPVPAFARQENSLAAFASVFSTQRLSLPHSAALLLHTERAVVALLGHRHRPEGGRDLVIEISSRRRNGEAPVEVLPALRLEGLDLLHELREVRGEIVLLLLHRARVVDDEDDVHLRALLGLLLGRRRRSVTERSVLRTAT